MKNSRTAFHILIGFFLLSICIQCTQKTKSVEECLSEIPSEELGTKVIRFPDVFKQKNQTGEYKLEERNHEENLIVISASNKLYNEVFSAKLFQDKENNSILAIINATTSIISSQDPLSGVDAPIPAYGLNIKFFKQKRGKWEDATSSLFPESVFDFLSNTYNFDLQSDENLHQITADFRKNLLAFQSPELKSEKIITLQWDGEQFVSYDKNAHAQDRSTHPALVGLEPKQERIGLLLGISSKETMNTYFIVFSKDTVELAAELDYITIPTGDSNFYYLDRVRHSSFSSCKRENCQHIYSKVVWSNEFATFQKLRNEGLNALKNKAQKENRCFATIDDSELSYVAKGFFVEYIKKSQWGCVEEATETSDSTYYKLVSFGGNIPTLASLTTEEKIGKARTEIIKKINTATKEDLDYNAKIALSYNLKRENGIVNLYAQTQKPIQNSQLYGGKVFKNIEYNLGKAPLSIIPNNDFPLNYQAFRGYINEIRDSFIAPTQSIVCVINDRELRCLDHTGKNLLFSLPMYKESMPNVVMVEWVSGEKIEQWTRRLHRNIPQ